MPHFWELHSWYNVALPYPYSWLAERCFFFYSLESITRGTQSPSLRSICASKKLSGKIRTRCLVLPQQRLHRCSKQTRNKTGVRCGIHGTGVAEAFSKISMYVRRLWRESLPNATYSLT